MRYTEIFELKIQAKDYIEVVLELYPYRGYETALAIRPYGDKFQVFGFRNKDY